MPRMVTRTPSLQPDRLPILTFRLGHQTYALLIEDVVEVEAMVELIPVLHGLPEVLGLANRHGAILPVIDLRMVFQQPAPPPGSSHFFIVAADSARQIGVLVDEVLQVEYVNFSQLEDTSASGQYIRGMINSRSELIPVIALAPLLANFLASQSSG
jgi:purine-binding chemotaxis protein CheW